MLPFVPTPFEKFLTEKTKNKQTCTHWNHHNTCLNALHASGDLRHLLMIFANSLELDQDQRSVRPDKKPFRVSNGLDLQTVIDTLIFFEKVNFKKVSRRQQKHEKLPSMRRVNIKGVLSEGIR